MNGVWYVILLLIAIAVIVVAVLSFGWATKGCRSSSSSSSASCCCRCSSSCSSSSSSSATGTVTGDTGLVETMPSDAAQWVNGATDLRNVIESQPPSAGVSHVAPILAARGARYRHQYIVHLKSNSNIETTPAGSIKRFELASSMVKSCAGDLAGAHSCDTMHQYADVFPGLSVKNLTPKMLERLRRDPRVAVISEDGQVASLVWSRDDIGRLADCDCSQTPSPAPVPPPPPVPSTQVVGWGVTRVGGPRSSWTIGDANSLVPVDIYVIDTGRPTHPDLNVVEGVTFVAGASDPTDKNGHATHVAGIAAAPDNLYGMVGTAPGARIHGVQVLNAAGSGSFSAVIAGVNFVLGRKRAQPSIPIVANLSLGAEVNTSAYNALDLAVANAVAGGVVVCVAAGNSGSSSTLTSPAHVSTAITVGSINQANQFSSFSNYGPMNTICAPGEKINSTYLNNGYATLSGTSMATPHVAGIVAAYLSRNPSATPAQVKNWLVTAAAPSVLNPAVAANLKPGTTNRAAWMGSI